MVTVSGRLLDFVEDPSNVAQVRVRAREVRPHGDGVMLDHPVKVDYAPLTGTVTFDAAAGTAGVIMWHAVGRSHASGSLPIVVPDGDTATLRECVEAALLADEFTLNALERLALEVTEYATQTRADATQTSSDRTAVEAAKGEFFDQLQVVTSPSDATVLGLVSDGADTATKRELESNFVTKKRGETRYVYVREDGDDTTGDGTFRKPFRQIQPALDSVYDGPVLPGSVIIDVREGTYQGGIRIPIARGRAQDDFIKINGRVGTDGVPTTLIQGTTGTGLLAEDGASVWMENLKFVGGFAVAVQLTRNVYGWFRNVHVDGQGAGVRGFSISQHCRYYVRGGIIENCTYAGIDEYFAVARSYATASRSEDQMLIRGCQIGIRAKEGCIGHMDYINVTDCDTGIELIQNSVANLKGATLKRNKTALGLVNSTSHNEGGIVWGTGADANAREVYSAGMSGELRAMMWSGEDMAVGATTGHRPLMLIANSYAERQIEAAPGSTVTAVSFSQAIPRAFFRTTGKHFKTSLLATFDGAGPTTPITVTLRAGSVLLGQSKVTEPGLLEVAFDTVCVQDLTTHLTKSNVVGAKTPGMQAIRSSTALAGVASGIATINIEATFTATGQRLRFQSAEIWG